MSKRKPPSSTGYVFVPGDAEGPPFADSSRARELTKVEQEDHIIRMMMAGRWFGGRSSEALAKEWGIHPRTVADRALVASGVIRRRGSPIEEFIDQKMAELEALQAAAMDEVKWFKVGDELVSKPAQNVGAAINAVRLQAEIKGALVRKVETKAVAADMTDDELRARLKAALDQAEERKEIH
ncbi:MAG: hypothetical protein V4529_16480 [Gemmatimonadota bacterium]